MKESVNAIIKRLGGMNKLTPADVPQLEHAKLKVLRLMADGQWHDAEEIIAASGQREGLRRMRELRKDGFTVEERRAEQNKREWQYRLAEKRVETCGAEGGAVATAELFSQTGAAQ